MSENGKAELHLPKRNTEKDNYGRLNYWTAGQVRSEDQYKNNNNIIIITFSYNSLFFQITLLIIMALGIWPYW